MVLAAALLCLRRRRHPLVLGGRRPQWLRVDLGATATITQVTLNWGTAYGRSFQIQTATAAGSPWTSIYSTTAGTGSSPRLASSDENSGVPANAVFGSDNGTRWAGNASDLGPNYRLP